MKSEMAPTRYMQDFLRKAVSTPLRNALEAGCLLVHGNVLSMLYFFIAKHLTVVRMHPREDSPTASIYVSARRFAQTMQFEAFAYDLGTRCSSIRRCRSAPCFNVLGINEFSYFIGLARVLTLCTLAEVFWGACIRVPAKAAKAGLQI